MFNVALVHPRIPPNTGQIARLCAATGASLHLVRPLGFRLDDRSLRRAGVDYWPRVDLHVHDALDTFLSQVQSERCWLFTKLGQQRYDRIAYEPGDWLVFGSETVGLPSDLIDSRARQTVRIPVRPEGVRSLNLASCASIVLYEALRQNGFDFESEPEGP